MFVLAYDLGGTKVAVGVVSSTSGKVIESVREPVLAVQGKRAVLDQLTRLGRQFIDRYSKIKRIGIASAGPLDPAKGVLLDPTNLMTEGKTWGKVPIVSVLQRSLKFPVVLENDAAAAILAEHWVGAAKGYDNAMILTLGTGLGTGVITNGKLVRAGRGLHTEAGHLIQNLDDKSAPCGCGNFGCAEAYLSGRSFTHRFRAKTGNTEISAEGIAESARRTYDPHALAAFDEYASHMAVAIHNYAVIYAPEVVILTGSFAAAADLFLKKTNIELGRLLQRRRAGVDFMPKLLISKLHNQAGLIGAAHIAMRHHQPLV